MRAVSKRSISMVIIKKIRNWVVRKFLKKELEELSDAKEAYILLKQNMQRNIEDFDKQKSSLTVVDIVRAQMEGINPKYIHDVTDSILNEIPESEVEEFLAKVHELKKDDALGRIIRYLKAVQMKHTATEALTIDTVNFGRASVNGLSLVDDEIDVLSTLYDERHADDDPDQSELM